MCVGLNCSKKYNKQDVTEKAWKDVANIVCDSDKNN